MSISNFFSQIESFLGILYMPTIIILQIIGILIATAIIVTIGKRLIRNIFQKQKKFKYSFNDKKLDTFSTLSISIFRYAMYILAAVMILSVISKVFDLTSVMAAAGIGGLAVGLGSRNLISDLVSGVFIVFEDQYAVGDSITIEGMSGTVEQIELRITKIRNFNGDLYIIPNGEVKKVTNHTRGKKTVIVDIPISYSSDINNAIEVSNNVCDIIKTEYPKLVENPKVLGITELGKENINLRIVATTVASEQSQIERRIRILIRQEFNKSNIDFSDKNTVIIQN